MKETTFIAPFHMEQRKKQRLLHHSVWNNERNNVYGTIPYGAMKETCVYGTIPYGIMKENVMSEESDNFFII